MNQELLDSSVWIDYSRKTEPRFQEVQDLLEQNLVGVVRLELTTPCSQSRCASQTALYPD